MIQTDLIAANRINWDERARLHATDETGMYRIAEVLSGEPVLHPIELSVLPDVKGLRIAHLQCHIGLDTISLAHMGADVVGLDFSDNALSAARDFARRAGRPEVTFVQSDVYAARDVLSGNFDMVFVTWGAINWLPDIHRWASVVGSLLKPGGRLFLAETHPSALVLEEIDGKLVPTYDWRTPIDKPVIFEETMTYTGDTRHLENARTYSWYHPMSDIFTGLAEADMSVTHLGEHETLVYRMFPSMIPADLDSKGRSLTYRMPDGIARFPLSFTLIAEKRR